MDRTRTESLTRAPISLFINGREVEALEGDTLLVAMLAPSSSKRDQQLGKGAGVSGHPASLPQLHAGA